MTGLSRLSWEKVDVSFHKSRQRLAAHSIIQVVLSLSYTLSSTSNTPNMDVMIHSKISSDGQSYYATTANTAYILYLRANLVNRNDLVFWFPF